MSKPRIFIGSSRESIDLVDALHAQLSYTAEVTPWSAGVFQANRYPMEDLEAQVDTNDFAVFIFSADDVIRSRGKLELIPRDNVIFELGLFWGKLRRGRVFFLIPDQLPEIMVQNDKVNTLHLPSDLTGLTTLKYEVRSDRNYEAAVRVACSQILKVVKELGAFSDPGKLLEKAQNEIRRKHQILQFFIDFSGVASKPDQNHFPKLYEALRNSFDCSALDRYKVTGAAVWKVEGTDGLRYAAGNVGRNRFFPFGANDHKQAGEKRIVVLDAYLDGKVQFLLYRTHVANEYLLCYPVDKKMVITIHITGPQLLTPEDLFRVDEDNEDLMSTINYLFGGDSE